MCVNCKEKGYSFGYTLKYVEYRGDIVFRHPPKRSQWGIVGIQLSIRPHIYSKFGKFASCGAAAETPIFSMINAKPSFSSTISRFTYFYFPQYHPLIKYLNDSNSPTSPKIYEYVDIYQYPNNPDRPYILIFYSFRNATQVPLENFRFYQFYDFDIYGQEAYNTDMVKYKPDSGLIYQFDANRGRQKSVMVGIGSTKDNKPSHYEGDSPELLKITPNCLELRDSVPETQCDCGVGLEWIKAELLPGHLEIFPVFMAFGSNEEEFFKNAEKAQIHLRKLVSHITKAVNSKFRQIIDPKLEKMSFSMREWC